jgi:hypothetical protein
MTKAKTAQFTINSFNLKEDTPSGSNTPVSNKRDKNVTEKSDNPKQKHERRKIAFTLHTFKGHKKPPD